MLQYINIRANGKFNELVYLNMRTVGNWRTNGVRSQVKVKVTELSNV